MRSTGDDTPRLVTDAQIDARARAVAREEIARALRELAGDCGESAALDWSYGRGGDIADAVYNSLCAVGCCAETLAASLEAAPREEARCPQCKGVGNVWRGGSYGEAVACPGCSEAREEARVYPCDKCGVMRSKAEGGTVFSVCDKCWDAAPTEDEAALAIAQPAPSSLPPLVGPRWHRCSYRDASDFGMDDRTAAREWERLCREERAARERDMGAQRRDLVRMEAAERILREVRKECDEYRERAEKAERERDEARATPRGFVQVGAWEEAREERNEARAVAQAIREHAGAYALPPLPWEVQP